MDIYLDMDGVLVDLEGHIEDWAERIGYEAERFRFWEFYETVIEYEPNWWEKAPPTPHYKDILKTSVRLVGPKNVHILTAIGPKDSPHKRTIIRNKQRWLRRHGILRYVQGDVLMVYRNQKGHYADPESILLDDHISNIKHWQRYGGIGILYDVDEHRKAMRKLEAAVLGDV